MSRMDRDAWIQAFVAELFKLRPHLDTGSGPSRLVLAIAAQALAQGSDPVVAARQWHARTPSPPPARKRGR
jgi:hypothetical protein